MSLERESVLLALSVMLRRVNLCNFLFAFYFDDTIKSWLGSPTRLFVFFSRAVQRKNPASIDGFAVDFSAFHVLRPLPTQVQSTTQQLGQICTEGVGEAKRRLEENRPGIDQFVKNIGDNMQQGVKKVQEVREKHTVLPQHLLVPFF